MCSARVKEGRVRACVCNVVVAFLGREGRVRSSDFAFVLELSKGIAAKDFALEAAKPRIGGLMAK